MYTVETSLLTAKSLMVVAGIITLRATTTSYPVKLCYSRLKGSRPSIMA